jgi:glycosyltransferase involved in cell wall biosynthesis
MHAINIIAVISGASVTFMYIVDNVSTVLTSTASSGVYTFNEGLTATFAYSETESGKTYTIAFEGDVMTYLQEGYRAEFYSTPKVFEVNYDSNKKTSTSPLIVNTFSDVVKNPYNAHSMISSSLQLDDAKFAEDRNTTQKFVYNQVYGYDDVTSMLKCCDGFCLPSIWEGLPITLLESLSAGCIPICAPVGGIVDVITDGVDGILAKSSNLDDYHDAMLKYLSMSDDQRAKMQQTCLKTFEKYNIVNTAQEYLNFYES